MIFHLGVDLVASSMDSELALRSSCIWPPSLIGSFLGALGENDVDTKIENHFVLCAALSFT
jgi:hypothetical protein